jgi:hypothetical protein
VSPEPEFSLPIVEETAASRMSPRGVLSDHEAQRPKSGDPDLKYLPATTQKIFSAVEKLSRDLTEIPAPLFTRRLSALIDDLVSNLVPLMAAEERFLYRHLHSPLVDALKEDHREVRRLVERLNMLLENLERQIGRASETGPVLTALLQLTSALGSLFSRQNAALHQLGETLPLDKVARLAAMLDAAAVDARERTMLIVWPEIPPTASTVLRHRPDLTAAHAMSVAEYDRRSHPGAAPAVEGKPSSAPISSHF